MFLRKPIMKSTENISESIERLKKELETAEVIVIGAGAGLSSAAGFLYSGQRFDTWFWDFREKYGIRDMYSGGFYPYETLEEYWAWWSRHIYINRYTNGPKDVYQRLLEMVKDKDYFVLTTNVDHCFQKAGFDKNRLFYTQGDYGLWQCSGPCHERTYDNENAVKDMLKAQGFVLDSKGQVCEPVKENRQNIQMRIPDGLVPHCPKCGRPMTMNLRCDDTFVQDEGWYRASERYEDFIRRHKKGHILFLELGVGQNTPGIIKYPFWQMVYQYPETTYACVILGEAVVPSEIKNRSICIDGDIGKVLENLYLNSLCSQ